MNRVIDVKLINPYNNCILGNIIFLQYLSISIDLVDQMGPCFYRLRCEIFQNLILRLMNTGFVRPAVATALTVYGIETQLHIVRGGETLNGLQQHLPFTVLKLDWLECLILKVAMLQQHLPFTVLKRGALSIS